MWNENYLLERIDLDVAEADDVQVLEADVHADGTLASWNLQGLYPQWVYRQQSIVGYTWLKQFNRN